MTGTGGVRRRRSRARGGRHLAGAIATLQRGGHPTASRGATAGCPHRYVAALFLHFGLAFLLRVPGNEIKRRTLRLRAGCPWPVAWPGWSRSQIVSPKAFRTALPVVEPGRPVPLSVQFAALAIMLIANGFRPVTERTALGLLQCRTITVPPSSVLKQRDDQVLRISELE
jgi:hypothetical protein